MPDSMAYHWWSAPAAPKTRPEPGPGGGAGVGVGVLGGKGAGSQYKSEAEHRASVGADPNSPVQTSASTLATADKDFPGQVEVKGVLPQDTSAPLAANQPSAQGTSTNSTQLSNNNPPTTHVPTDIESKASLSGLPEQQPAAQPGGVSARGKPGDPFGCSPTYIQLTVLSSLRKLLQSKLNAIAGGPAQEDELEAQQAGCTPAARMALLFRANQKCIATAALHSLAAAVTEAVSDASCAVAGHARLLEEQLPTSALLPEGLTVDQVRPGLACAVAVHHGSAWPTSAHEHISGKALWFLLGQYVQ